jgi:Leucine rich repeat/Fibronectin type III domain
MLLDLGVNRLSGTIPVQLGNLTNLQQLDLALNTLTGPIPVELGNLTKLTGLFLDSNGLTGPIPVKLGNLTKLTVLDFEFDGLTGPIPAFGKAKSLEQLFLDHNHLTGGFPASLTTLPKLSLLDLDGNALTGTLPDALTTMHSLTKVDLGWNAFQASAATAAFLSEIEWDFFLDARSPLGFLNTQTTPPSTGLSVTGATTSSLTLNWDPILYTFDPGFYSLFMSDTPSGPSAPAQSVPAGKTATQVTLEGLKVNTTYHFYMVTTTLPNANNANQVQSLPGPVFSGTTSP